jgi:adenylyltransferase/sulfurtransferase
MKGISAKELLDLFQHKNDFQLIDVRESFEHDEFNIGGTLIPLSQIIQHIGSIEKDKPVVIYCHKGIRSQIAIQRLQEKFPFNNLVNLIGGTEAWKKEVLGV